MCAENQTHSSAIKRLPNLERTCIEIISEICCSPLEKRPITGDHSQ